MSSAKIQTSRDLGWFIKITYPTGDGWSTDGEVYPCTRVSINMSVNSIPVAMVSIPSGSRIHNYKYKIDVKKILKSLLGHTAPGSSNLYNLPHAELYSGLELKSTGYEGSMDEDSIDIDAAPAFRGYVSTASISLGSTPGIASLDVAVINEAGLLQQVVLGQHYNVSGASLISMITSTSSVTAGERMTSKILWGYSDSAISTDATLDKRLATIANSVISKKLTSMGQSTSDNQLSYDKLITNTIFSKLKVLSRLAQDWDNQVHGLISTSIDGANLFAAIQPLMTEQFMLNLYPRYVDQEFKLELGMSHAWDGEAAFTIPASDIIGISCNFAPGNAINVPNVFLVNFNNTVQFSVKYQDKYPCRPGVYAADPDLAETLKAAYESGGKTNISADKEMRWKCREYAAPAWVLPLAIAASADNDGTGSSDALNVSQQSKVNSDNSAQAAPDNGELGSAADRVAKALFAYIYGCQDSCSVSLRPDLGMRAPGSNIAYFCEEHLGDCVDVTADSSLILRGVVTGVTYQWNGGDGNHSSAMYQLNITRLRILEGDETPIKCDLYEGDEQYI